MCSFSVGACCVVQVNFTDVNVSNRLSVSASLLVYRIVEIGAKFSAPITHAAIKEALNRSRRNKQPSVDDRLCSLALSAAPTRLLRME